VHTGSIQRCEEDGTLVKEVLMNDALELFLALTDDQKTDITYHAALLALSQQLAPDSQE